MVYHVISLLSRLIISRTQGIDSPVKACYPICMGSGTAPIEQVWTWLCNRLPDLAESPGLGCPPTARADWDNFCEGRLLGCIARALGRGLSEVRFSECSLSCTPAGRCHSVVEVFVDWGLEAWAGRGEAECAWGDPTRFPSKEARLRAAADLLRQMEPELAAERAAKAEEAAHGITISGTPLRRILWSVSN